MAFICLFIMGFSMVITLRALSTLLKQNASNINLFIVSMYPTFIGIGLTVCVYGLTQLFPLANVEVTLGTISTLYRLSLVLNGGLLFCQIFKKYEYSKNSLGLIILCLKSYFLYIALIVTVLCIFYKFVVGIKNHNLKVKEILYLSY